MKNNRQHNGQKKKDKQRPTKHTHKPKDRITRTPLNSGAPEGYKFRQFGYYTKNEYLIFREEERNTQFYDTVHTLWNMTR